MQVGSGYASRPVCDGQSLASPGRQAPKTRRYPSSEDWFWTAGCFMEFAKVHGTAGLLMNLALGRVDESPFDRWMFGS